ncbi:uncharacterized protein F5891DRAFT_992179 [Suillus fuscotomentosus]|uniref:Uncharacterized protein n=1 Tax=Suillus fuscotomentosus TaxID=1912939 RepID=A0AAD4HSA5_9AGAM|nr:uncharacterized protein F5891DRAFT_992179 [Suillus fuscotomentosus]KAG1908235.1 hypothetical protein F5891DRAFT_992179 [Suillus fuscotomentosus]
MADIENIPRTTDLETAVNFAAEDGVSPEPHDEHEAFVVVEGPVTQDEIGSPADGAVDDDVINQIVMQEATQPGDTPKDAAPATKPEVTKKLTAPKAVLKTGKEKPVISAKAVPTRSAPPTPTVKKVLNSGTFGSGATSTKPSPASKVLTSTPLTIAKTTPSAPSSLRKSISTPSANSPVKTAPTMASSRSPPAPPSRRSSVLPPRAPSATGNPPPSKSRGSLLASLTSSKPPAEASAPSRSSVISPSGSTASLRSNTAASAVSRPRASISDVVRRTPSTSSSKGNSSTVAPTRQATSISSIREVNDGKAVEEMQQKLKEAMDALSVKTQAVVDLSATLDAARADAGASQSSLLQLQQERAAAVSDLQELNATLQRDRAEHSRVLVLLESMKRELDAAKWASSNHTNNVYDLQSQVVSLTAELVAARENLETLRASSERSSSEAAAAAQNEREAVLRARNDYETISAELEALRASHASTIENFHVRLSETHERAADADALEAQVRQLRAEREESANKLSELEVEILELKESQEQAEDDHAKALDRLKRVEEELAHAAAATQSALAVSKVREEQHAEQMTEVKEAHSGELQTANDELSNIVADLAALREELAATHAAHEQTKIEAQNTAEEHERQIEETESEFFSKHLELSEEIKRITIELESQEARYNAKVDALKAEHDLLLQEAFERAKNEAADVHSEDLQSLRAESQATIEQLRSAHQSTVDGLKADHEDVLTSQVGDLEKKLNNQSLELRATQDDLAKAKTALESSRSDAESLKAQLEDARAAFVAASTSADQASEIDRLTKELANFRDENVMLNDVLTVTKESLSEMSANHTKELEEAARGRVEDVMSLRAAHEEEIGRLATQKSELSLKLSDLEGEIATLQAQVAAAAAAAPKNSGAMSPSSTMVTREELQRMHEAHNMKMHDVVADHERIVRDLRNEIDGLQNKVDEVHQDIARKSMEIQYLEQEQEESQDSITRLKADIEQLSGTSNA